MNLEERVKDIEERNRRVETDKAWETSIARRAAVAVLIFCAAWGWLLLQGSDTALRDALFPALGYILSTTALSALRVQWEARQRSKNTNIQQL